MGRLRSADYYDRLFTERKDYNTPAHESWYVPMWELALVHLNDFGKDVSILDMGCGTGQFGEWIMSKGFRNYKGFDFSNVGVKKAQARLGDRVYLSDIYDKSNYNTPVGVFTCFEVLEHLQYDTLVLNMLPVGCNFVFSVPATDDPSHVRVFKTPESIVNRYESCLLIHDIQEYHYRFVVKATRK